MAVAVYPLDAISSAPSYTGRMLRDTIAAVLGGASSSRPLGIRSGLRPGTPTDCITMSGLNWTAVKSFAGAVDVQTAAEAGPYLFAITGSPTGAINAADASNPRKDILTLLISDNAEDGSGVASGSIVYTQGVASATPAQPATPVRSFLLGVFDVPKSGTGSPTFTLTTAVLAAAGGIVKATTSSDYPASPTLGDYIDDAVLGLLRWNGTAWVRYGANKAVFTRASATVASSTSFAALAFATATVDNGCFSNSAGVFTCLVAGTYEFELTVVFAGNASGNRGVRFLLPSTVARSQQLTVVGSLEYTMTICWTLTFAVGDSITVQSQQNSGSSLAELGEVVITRMS